MSNVLDDTTQQQILALGRLGWGTRASIADIDLRALSPNSPSTYWCSDTCCAR